jgi:hypothetical protein
MAAVAAMGTGTEEKGVAAERRPTLWAGEKPIAGC